MRTILFGAMLAAAVTTTAAADPIPLPAIAVRVTSGVVITEPGERLGPPESGPNHSVDVIGPNFQLSGFGTGSVECHFECLPGQAFSMSTRIFVRDGTVTFDGRSIEFDAIFGPNFGGATLELSGLNTFTVPNPIPGDLIFTSRFQMEGGASVPDFVLGPDDEVTEVQRSWTLTGNGTATGRYSFSDDFGPTALRFDHIRFDFDAGGAPIPEPATILLLGGGLTAICAKKRRVR